MCVYYLKHILVLAQAQTSRLEILMVINLIYFSDQKYIYVFEFYYLLEIVVKLKNLIGSIMNSKVIKIMGSMIYFVFIKIFPINHI